jgi:hypothetical protein
MMLRMSAGAGGNFGAEAAAKAAPDGYTIVICTVSLAVSPTLYRGELNYDALRDLAPIGLVASQAQTLAVHPSLPARSEGDGAAREDAARKGELRHRRQRHLERSRRADLQELEHGQRADRALQGHRAGDDGDPQR